MDHVLEVRSSWVNAVGSCLRMLWKANCILLSSAKRNAADQWGMVLIAVENVARLWWSLNGTMMQRW